MVAVITPCPIRRKNFADLSIGKDFIRLNRGWTILLPPDKVKNGEQVSLEVPGFLTEFIDHYIDNVRSTFPGGTCSSKLWLTWFGKSMSGHAVYLRMVEVTEKHFGKALNPHIFRDCAATFLSWESPAAAKAGQGLLMHRSDRTTQKHYTHARQIEAGRRVNELLYTLSRHFQAGATSEGATVRVGATSRAPRPEGRWLAPQGSCYRAGLQPCLCNGSLLRAANTPS